MESDELQTILAALGRIQTALETVPSGDRHAVATLRELAELAEDAAMAIETLAYED